MSLATRPTMASLDPLEPHEPERARYHFAVTLEGARPRAVLASAATLELTIGDLTLDESAAVVNPTNGRLDGGGMVDLAIRRAAGPALGEACRAAVRARGGAALAPGEAVITPGFALRAGYVIHCVPPIYTEDPTAAPAHLAACCRAALALTRERGLSSIALPSIATGALGYPLEQAAPIIVSTLLDELGREGVHFRARIVLFGPSMLEAYVQATKVCLRAGASPSRPQAV